MKKRKKNEKAVGAGRMLAWQSRAVSQGCVLMAVGLSDHLLHRYTENAAPHW